jgi:hypothetical protein
MFGSNNHGREKILINFARSVFLGLIIFEFLNVLKIVRLNTQFTWLGLFITAVVLFALLETVAYRYEKNKGHKLHWSVWIIAAYALSLDAAGDFFFLYGRFDWWDRVVHFSTSAIGCFILFAVINAFWIDRFSYALLFREGRLKLALFLAATSTISMGAWYEIEEYTEDLLFHTNRLGPGVDTADDLMMNTLGVLTTVLIIMIHYLLTHKRKVIE